jgi:hypothetical protein
MKLPRAFAIALIALSAMCLDAKAGLILHRRRGTPPPGRPRAIEHSDHRAGHPLQTSPHAKPTQTPAYLGYYVGGGAPCAGCPRRIEDGTWGRDYIGLHLPRLVDLGWSHGRRYQGGTGSYGVDGAFVNHQ